jgi:hypothetical protein
MAEQTALKHKQIILTHMVFHVQKFRKPYSWSRAIEKSERSGKPGIVNVNMLKLGGVDVPVLTAIPSEFQQQAIAAEKEGYVIDYVIPQNGIPVYAGSDVYEYVAAMDRRKWKPVLG